MLRRWIVATGLVLASGCAAREPGTVLRAADVFRGCADAPQPNLVLGPSAEYGRWAEAFTYRATWPAVELGYRLDEVSSYIDFSYDVQTFYERIGGGFFRESQSIQSGVLIR